MANLLIPDLLPNTQYAIEVRAVRTNGVSEWSPQYQFQTVNDTVLPLAPLNTTWAVSGDQFLGSWDTSTLNVNGEVINVVRYEVELVANSLTRILSVPQTTGSKVYFTFSFEDNRALFGSPQPSVQMRVRSVSNIDTKSAWTAPLSASNPVPGNPTSVTAVGGPNQIALSWTPPSDNDVIGYNIYVGAALVTFTNSTTWIYYTTNYSATTLTVKAVDKFNQLSTGANSNSTSATNPSTIDAVAPAAPATVTATGGFDTSTQQSYIDVSWTAVADSDLANYLIRYSTNGTNWNYITVPKGTLATRISVNPSTTYYIGVAARDWSANTSGFTNASTYPLTSTADTTAPSQPAAPTVAANTLQIQVSHSGLKQAGGAMESDVSYYEVYASTTTGFTPSSSNMVGTMQNGPVVLGTFDIPATGGSATQTWYVKVIAVDRSNNKSTASNQSSGNVALIAATNIVDATITNAKISDLSASKITAGTISAQTITIGATGALVVDSTGVIRSNNYVPGTSGYQLTNTSLEINGGSISASALNIQIGANIMRAKYADFEANSDSYPTSATWPTVLGIGAGTTATISTAQKYTNTQSLLVTNTAGASRGWLFADSQTDYNVFVTPSTRYIISAYIYNGGGASFGGYFGIKQQDGTYVNGGGITFANTAGWVRYSNVVTTTSTGTAVNITFTPTGNCTAYIDAIQIEPAINSTVTAPSPWAPPGNTRIDGGIIRTGTIQSTAFGSEWDAVTQSYVTSTTQPAWSIDTNGAALFSSINVLGTVVVGDPADVPNSSKYIIGSAFYVPGESGWIMYGDGNVEFNQITADSINGNSIKAGTLAADRLTAGVLGADIDVMGGGGFTIFDTSGTIEVIKLNPTDGLFIDPPGDAYIKIPTSGAPLEIKNVSLSATDADFFGNLSIFGSDNYISGDLMLEKSIPNPLSPPAVTSGWSDSSTYFATTPPAGYGTFGLLEDTTGNYWVTGIHSVTAKNGQIWKIDKTTGAYSSVVSQMSRTDTVTYSSGGYNYSGTVTRGPDLLRGLGKIVVSGTTYYAALVHYGAQSGTISSVPTNPPPGVRLAPYTWPYSLSALWQVRLYAVGNSAGTSPNVAWTWTPGAVSNPFMTSDGTYLYIVAAANASPYNFTVTRYAYNGTGATTVASSTGGGVNTSMAGLYVGAADFGATRYVFGGSMTDIWSLSGVSTTNDAATTFPRANNDTPWGIYWDGTQFRSINGSGKIYKYSTYLGATATKSVKYTWYDSDINPTTDPDPNVNGTHESLGSPPANYSFGRRGWVKVTTGAPSDNGGVNDPDSVRIYINDYLQPDLGSGVITALYGTHATSGTTIPTLVNQFESLTAPGQIFSRATDGTTPYIKLKGDGSGRVGPLSWDANGNRTDVFASWNTVDTTSVSNSVWTTRKGWGEIENVGGTNWFVVSALGIITVKIAGLYAIQARIMFGPSVAGRRDARIFKNATTELDHAIGETDTVSYDPMLLSWTGHLAANDTIEIQGLQSSGAALAWYGGGGPYNWVQIRKVG